MPNPGVVVLFEVVKIKECMTEFSIRSLEKTVTAPSENLSVGTELIDW
jgi:hypothetical protein